MGSVVSPFVAATLLGGGLSLALGVAVLRAESNAISRPLVVLLFGIAAWALPYGVSLTCGTLDCVLFWQRLRYPGTVAAPVAFLVVALRYAGYERWCTRRVYGLLAIVPAASVLVVWTNPLHGLFWQSTGIARVAGVTVLTETFGLFRPVFLVYLYAVVAAALLVLAVTVVRSGPIYRKQALLLFVGGLVPLLTNAANWFASGSNTRVNLTAAAMTVTGVSFALALFRFDLLTVRPVAREQLVDDLDDGVIVVGPRDRIRDINPAAAAVFPDAEPGDAVESVFDAGMAPDGGELTAETDAGERVFRVRSKPLEGGRENGSGRIVHLRDITAVAKREQRISVLNRVLRHNIRNEMNIIGGLLDTATMQLEEADGDDGEAVESYLRRSQEHATDVAAMADKARSLERSLRQREDTVTVPLRPAVRLGIDEVREAHPDADLVLEWPDDAPAEPKVRVVDDELFRVALSELAENAVVHNDTTAPTVTVTVDVDPDTATATVRVADRGPGIPERQTEVLTARRESQLDHGEGLGLWITEWFATLSRGDLAFAENEPRGTVVSLTLRRASPE